MILSPCERIGLEFRLTSLLLRKRIWKTSTLILGPRLFKEAPSRILIILKPTLILIKTWVLVKTVLIRLRLNAILEGSKFVARLILSEICWNLRCDWLERIWVLCKRIWTCGDWLKTVLGDCEWIWVALTYRFEIVLSDRKWAWACCVLSGWRICKSICDCSRLNKWISRGCPKSSGPLQKRICAGCLRLLVGHERIGWRCFSDGRLSGLRSFENRLRWFILWGLVLRLGVDKVDWWASRCWLAILRITLRLKFKLDLDLTLRTRRAEPLTLKRGTRLFVRMRRLLFDRLLEYRLFFQFHNWVFWTHLLGHYLFADRCFFSAFLFTFFDLVFNGLGKIDFVRLFTLFLSLLNLTLDWLGHLRELWLKIFYFFSETLGFFDFWGIDLWNFFQKFTLHIFFCFRLSFKFLRHHLILVSLLLFHICNFLSHFVHFDFPLLLDLLELSLHQLLIFLVMFLDAGSKFFHFEWLADFRFCWVLQWDDLGLVYRHLRIVSFDHNSRFLTGIGDKLG